MLLFIGVLVMIVLAVLGATSPPVTFRDREEEARKQREWIKSCTNHNADHNEKQALMLPPKEK
jgi:hypothetical protein